MIRIAVLVCAALLLPQAARAEPPRVVADIRPVQALVARVMQGVGTPDVLIGPDVSPHHAAMRPSEARVLADADLVFWVGAGLTPWLQKSIDTLAADARVVALMDSEGTVRLPLRDSADFGGHDDHDHDHDHDHAPDGAGEQKAGTPTDPHGWLDPLNGKAWLDTIAASLAQADLKNAGIYAANAADGQAEIDREMSRIEAALGDVQGVRFVVAHDAYQYFEARFGIDVAGAISLGDAAAPGPAHISRLRAASDGAAALCILSDPQTSPSLAGAIFDGDAARTAEIDSMGLDIPLGSDFYTTLLGSIAKAIASCR